jgi:hypothetical protein
VISRSRRLATPEERATLEAHAKPGPPAGWLDSLGEHFMILFGFAVAGLLLSVAPAGLIKGLGFGISIVQLILLLGFVGGFGVGIAVLRKGRAFFEQKRAAYRRDLTTPEVEVLHCTATDAVKVEEVEDEGPGFFLQVEDSQLLYLQGQYLYELEEKRLFPSSIFEITRARYSGLVLGISCLGDPISPRTRGPFTDDEYIPAAGELLTARLNSLDADLRRLKANIRKKKRNKESLASLL